MLYNGPLDQPSNPNAAYVDGVPAAGIEGSIVPAASIEFDQREIVEVINRAYLRGYFDFSGTTCGSPSNADQQQLRKAIEGFITDVEYFIDTHVTYTVHGPGAKFTDLNAAMEWLAKYKILRDGYVTLQIAGAASGVAEQFVYSTDVILEHPSSSKISIVGAPLLAAAPNDASFQVSGVGYNLADANAQVAMLRATLGTELHFINGHGLIVFGDFTIQNLLITGDGAPTTNQYGALCVFNTGLPIIGNFASHGGGSTGIMVNQGYLICVDQWCSASGHTGLWGWEFQGDCLMGPSNGGISASNKGIGFMIQTATSIKTGLCAAKGNGGDGFQTVNGLNALNLYSYNNAGYGVYAFGSTCDFPGSYLANNGSGYAAYADIGSTIYLSYPNRPTVGALSPPANTVGNRNSLIVV
jgi:hypothetical protein